MNGPAPSRVSLSDSWPLLSIEPLQATNRDQITLVHPLRRTGRLRVGSSHPLQPLAHDARIEPQSRPLASAETDCAEPLGVLVHPRARDTELRSDLPRG